MKKLSMLTAVFSVMTVLSVGLSEAQTAPPVETQACQSTHWSIVSGCWIAQNTSGMHFPFPGSGNFSNSTWFVDCLISDIRDVVATCRRGCGPNSYPTTSPLDYDPHTIYNQEYPFCRLLYPSGDDFTLANCLALRVENLLGSCIGDNSGGGDTGDPGNGGTP